MESVPQWLLQVFIEYSTDRYHVEHYGYKYNHLYHGFVALWKIGANEKRIREFADEYAERLQPVRIRPHETVPTYCLLGEPELQALLGQRKRYLYLVAHFQQRLVDLGNDFDLLINKEFPALVPALAASAFHGIIQMGYGFYMKDKRSLCESLAYMHFGYIPQVISSERDMVACLGLGKMDFIDVLRETKKDGKLLAYMHSHKMVFEDDRHNSDFLRRFHTILIDKGADLVALIGKIQMPEWFDKDHLDATKLEKIGKWMLDVAILMYGLSELKNNLFIIHLVTTTWSIQQILPLLQDPDVALKTIAYTLSSMIAGYIVEDCPDLADKNLTELVPESWETIKRDILNVQDCDEHQYKVVQVCLMRSENGDADDKTRDWCQKAAHMATYFPISRACPT